MRVASLAAHLSSCHCLSHCAFSLVVSLPLCSSLLWSCRLSCHDASILAPLSSSCISNCTRCLSCRATYLIVLPLSSHRLSHRSGWLLHPCLSRCAAASLVAPPLSSRFSCHAASSLVTPPIISDAATNARYLPDTANNAGKPRALVCVPTCLLHCPQTIHRGTSCPSHFCDLCLTTSGVDVM